MDIRELETPCYILKTGEFEQNMRTFQAAFRSRWGENTFFGYSVKTNNLLWLLRRALTEGFYAEVVSPDEFYLAERCGCPR